MPQSSGINLTSQQRRDGAIRHFLFLLAQAVFDKKYIIPAAIAVVIMVTPEVRMNVQGNRNLHIQQAWLTVHLEYSTGLPRAQVLRHDAHE